MYNLPLRKTLRDDFVFWNIWRCVNLLNFKKIWCNLLSFLAHFRVSDLHPNYNNYFLGESTSKLSWFIGILYQCIKWNDSKMSQNLYMWSLFYVESFVKLIWRSIICFFWRNSLFPQVLSSVLNFLSSLWLPFIFYWAYSSSLN